MLARRLVQPVDAAARAKARLHLLDWLGCVAGGVRAAPHLVPGRSALEAATLLGNVLEMDDIHRAAILHPGPVVWPAAIGAAQAAGASFGAMLDAAVRGYEAMISIGATFDARHYAFHHNTATAGVFGAAAAVWSVADDSPEHLVSAFGLAGSVAAGLWRLRHEAGDTKQFHILHAVRTGRQAARESRLLRGPRFILEGQQGLYAATCDTPRPERLLGLDGWRIFEVSFKPWAACRHAHPAIDAALDLRARTGLHGAIRVETYSDALTFCDRPDPGTTAEAKFSLQHALAVVAVRGEPGPDDFEPAAIADPVLAAARARVTIAEDPAFTARFPDHFGARVTSGGLSAECIDTRGDPERPLSAAGITRKACSLAEWAGQDAGAA